MHRLRVAHSIARVRLIRPSFTIADLPVGGSRQTPMKMGHGLVNGRHTATFGSMARHISDYRTPTPIGSLFWAVRTAG